MIESATLVSIWPSCYALRHPNVPEDREPFFQLDYDQASLAEHLGFRSERGSWEEQIDHDATLDVIAEAIAWLDAHDGEVFTTRYTELDAYFTEEDREWR